MNTITENKLRNVQFKRKSKYILSLLTTLLFLAGLPFGTQAQNKPDPITENEKKQVIDFLNKLLNDQYIYPKVAEKMTDLLSTNLTNGLYKSITNTAEFADKLTNDLISVSNDKHFNVVFDPEWIKDSKRALTKNDSLELSARELPEMKKENFGFKELKILEGNVGYLNLVGFCPTIFGGETAVAAMNFLSNADVIIIDLRNNGGGSPEMVQLLSSYFFNPEPVLLVEFYIRKGDKTTQDYTLPYLPGKRMADKPLYILTSHKTFSAAESFATIFKNRKKAIIIGETSGGGAHPVDQMIINDKFAVSMPVARPIDPITKSDWEGIGVKPDFEVPAKDALMTAQIKAVEKLAASTKDNANYLWQLDGLKGKQNPINIFAPKLKSYAGNYGERKLILAEGNLFFQRDGDEKHKLIPITQNLFAVEDLDYLRIKIVLENDKVVAINRLFIDGNSKISKRDK